VYMGALSSLSSSMAVPKSPCRTFFVAGTPCIRQQVKSLHHGGRVV
jgi:hypothetical protein